jgi:hypothetical protein
VDAINQGQVAWDPSQLTTHSLLALGVLPDAAERERQQAARRRAAGLLGAGGGRGGGRAGGRSGGGGGGGVAGLLGRAASPLESPPPGRPPSRSEAARAAAGGQSGSAGARFAATAGTKRGSSSLYLGVCRPSSRMSHPKPWMAQLSAGHLGSAWWCFFETEEEAAQAYDKVALAVRGVGCATNFGESKYTRVSGGMEGRGRARVLMPNAAAPRPVNWERAKASFKSSRCFPLAPCLARLVKQPLVHHLLPRTQPRPPQDAVEWGGLQVRQRNPNVPLQHPWVTHLNPPPEEQGAAGVADGSLGAGSSFDRAPSGGSDLGLGGDGDSRPASALGDMAAAAAGPSGRGANGTAAAALPKLAPAAAALLQAQAQAQAAAGLRGGLANPGALLAPARGGKPLAGGAGGKPLTVGGAGKPLAGLPLLGAPGIVDPHKLQLAMLQASVAAATSGGVLPVVAPPAISPAAQAALTQQLQQQLQAVAARQKQKQQQQQQAAAAAAAAPAPGGAAPGEAGDDDAAATYKGVVFIPSAPPKRRYRAVYSAPGGGVLWKKGFEHNRQAAIVWDCVALAVEGPGAALNFEAGNYSAGEVRTAAALVWKQSPGVAMAHPACAELAPPVKGEAEAVGT